MNEAASPHGHAPARTATFLFTDIEGSTRLLRELGDTYATLLCGEAVAAARAEGRAMSTERAVEYALDWDATGDGRPNG